MQQRFSHSFESNATHQSNEDKADDLVANDASMVTIIPENLSLALKFHLKGLYREHVGRVLLLLVIIENQKNELIMVNLASMFILICRLCIMCMC